MPMRGRTCRSECRTVPQERRVSRLVRRRYGSCSLTAPFSASPKQGNCISAHWRTRDRSKRSQDLSSGKRVGFGEHKLNLEEAKLTEKHHILRR
ncbi:hypothetical protein PHSY_002399 [Pseudozyma hubeiensis SY62]|uniref:Uncharacterized protein n=1 Tax=Pseudozyma hubeiensis (strain SY62) TaxID=1305764 RepID=R9P0Y2_PSEHS|nr:hypothetical protein PHSY_002399 [Pseudozyma hubeiensis SY62]GAC94826.1 hypothetical protein PHSY_002399 [Pseudozyma hubeiensis SY62]